MKFFIVVLALVAVAVGQQQSQIISQSFDISPDGSYQFNYQTDNGISASEQGSPRAAGPEGNAVAADGTFQYTAPDGTPISLSYTADENGFQPQGAHLPVAPPVPEAIQRAIQYILAHPQQNQQFN